MSKEDKISLLFDKKDYVKKISDDDVINIVGTKGSGKTTSTIKYIKDDGYIVINCDKLFDMPDDNKNMDSYLPEIKELLRNKYGEIYNNEKFIDCYLDIIEFIKKHNKKAIIEGNVIYDIDPITKLKGTVIVKRTGVLKCFIRAVKRDYPNSYFLNLEIQKHGKLLGRFYRLKNTIKRRKSIFKECHRIENIISVLNQNDLSNKLDNNKIETFKDNETIKKPKEIQKTNNIQKQYTYQLEQEKNVEQLVKHR